MRAKRSGPDTARQLGDAELLARGDADSFAEFFAAALNDRDRYRPSRGAPTTWLYAIAGHKLTDWLRRGYAEDRARRRLGMERIELSDADVRELEHLGGEVSVIDMLDELPTEQRAAVQARLIQGRAYGEIAGAEGVSQAAVRQRVSRGLAGLRRRIGGRV
jgi:RNA polymerase sigma factor (sigma-70 family)